MLEKKQYNLMSFYKVVEHNIDNGVLPSINASYCGCFHKGGLHHLAGATIRVVNLVNYNCHP